MLQTAISIRPSRRNSCHSKSLARANVGPVDAAKYEQLVYIRVFRSARAAEKRAWSFPFTIRSLHALWLLSQVG